MFKQKSEGPIKENTHLVLDAKTGAILKASGANQFYMPHGLSIDDKDNMWMTDVALHQVRT